MKKQRKPNRMKHVLSEKQESFCLFYVIRAHYCGRTAAIMAGYEEASAHVRACRLMKKSKIRNRINELIKENKSLSVKNTDKTRCSVNSIRG